MDAWERKHGSYPKYKDKRAILFRFFNSTLKLKIIDPRWVF
jgi:hypothetical protein